MKSTLNIKLTFLITVASLSALAQKLPNKQEGSVRAPSAVKIDGKVNEWNFKAYNNATDVFYTVAHDDENIYLAIKATDPSIVRKIISGGVSLVINNIAKKSDVNAARISYPLFNYKNKPDIKFSFKGVPADSIDYFVSANNKSFVSKGKFIRVAGIQGVDTLLSVYNTEGINLAASFDKEMNYTYELAIARKLIKDALSADGKFAYKIMLNAMAMDDLPGVTINREENGTIKSINITKTDMPSNPNQSMSRLTDVSGEYSIN